jgi:hypothetical protein
VEEGDKPSKTKGKIAEIQAAIHINPALLVPGAAPKRMKPTSSSGDGDEESSRGTGTDLAPGAVEPTDGTGGRLESLTKTRSRNTKRRPPSKVGRGGRARGAGKATLAPKATETTAEEDDDDDDDFESGDDQLPKPAAEVPKVSPVTTAAGAKPKPIPVPAPALVPGGPAPFVDPLFGTSDAPIARTAAASIFD